jgi:hypothetical protein
MFGCYKGGGAFFCLLINKYDIGLFMVVERWMN